MGTRQGQAGTLPAMCSQGWWKWSMPWSERNALSLKAEITQRKSTWTFWFQLEKTQGSPTVPLAENGVWGGWSAGQRGNLGVDTQAESRDTWLPWRGQSSRGGGKMRLWVWMGTLTTGITRCHQFPIRGMWLDAMCSTNWALSNELSFQSFLLDI